MYRFRKIENLLGKREELENQEIYFSDIASLNDPMEGFRECFWSGDLIVWKNLLRHYLLCLEHVYLSTSLSLRIIMLLAEPWNLTKTKDLYRLQAPPYVFDQKDEGHLQKE